MNEILTSQSKVLVTGPTSFLGYHVVKRLNERGIRPRVLVPQETDPALLQKNLDVDIIRGTVEDEASLRTACEGIETVFHLSFLVSIGGGLETRMQEFNVGGTRRLLDAAARSGVTRVIVASSALAVGVNRNPQAIDETADWDTHHFDLTYALTRRQAEEEALARSSPDFSVISVNPSFTMGPEDYIGAPANKLLQAVSAEKLPVIFTVGFGCLDVRDFSEGMVLAAERGRSGQRYLLNGHNVMIDDLLQQVAAIAGVKPPRWRLPIWVAHVMVAIVTAVKTLRKKQPTITRSVLQILGRYAWYDTTRAQQELGWTPRPLQETLEDTLRWLRENETQP
jgi:dihydroflavonol-4-reductase